MSAEYIAISNQIKSYPSWSLYFCWEFEEIDNKQNMQNEKIASHLELPNDYTLNILSS